jgi:hypothetical protein
MLSQCGGIFCLREGNLSGKGGNYSSKGMGLPKCKKLVFKYVDCLFNKIEILLKRAR